MGEALFAGHHEVQHKVIFDGAGEPILIISIDPHHNDVIGFAALKAMNGMVLVVVRFVEFG